MKDPVLVGRREDVEDLVAQTQDLAQLERASKAETALLERLAVQELGETRKIGAVFGDVVVDHLERPVVPDRVRGESFADEAASADVGSAAKALCTIFTAARLPLR